MMDFIAQGGFFMYPILAIAVVIAGLGVWLGVRLRRTEGPDPAVETGIDATLFWGGWALLLGLLGTFGGIYQAAGAISRAGEVAAPLAWGGIRVALSTTLLGLALFALAALLWFALRAAYRRQVRTAPRGG